jgi:hypothetical protein
MHENLHGLNPFRWRSIAVALIALLLTNGSGRAASAEKGTANALVTVRIYDNFGVPVEDLTAARTEAETILREAGIEPVWLHCAVIEAEWQSSMNPCHEEVGPGEVVVRILGSSGLETASARVPLGEAVVNIQSHTGWLASVFADRVASTSDRAGANPRGVLGRVIAHEIGHLLLGTHDHSMHGLMRATWTDQELRRPIGLEWHFSVAQARRMRAGIVERADRTGM